MAKPFHVSVPHSLAQEAARRRIQLLVAETQTRLAGPDGTPEEWEGNRCRFRLKMGLFAIEGTIEVGDTSVEVHGTLPWGGGRYATRVERVVGERLEALLKSGPGEPPAGPTPDPPLRSI